VDYVISSEFLVEGLWNSLGYILFFIVVLVYFIFELLKYFEN
jgi:hypothetical protein